MRSLSAAGAAGGRWRWRPRRGSGGRRALGRAKGAPAGGSAQTKAARALLAPAQHFSFFQQKAAFSCRRRSCSFAGCRYQRRRPTKKEGSSGRCRAAAARRAPCKRGRARRPSAEGARRRSSRPPSSRSNHLPRGSRHRRAKATGRPTAQRAGATRARGAPFSLTASLLPLLLPSLLPLFAALFDSFVCLKREQVEQEFVFLNTGFLSKET